MAELANSAQERNNNNLTIGRVYWEAISSYLSTKSLVELNVVCAELHYIISNSNYLVLQTLFQLIKRNNNIIECVGVGDDMDLLINGVYNSLQNRAQLSSILEIFNPAYFQRLSLFNNTDLFQCYSRLMSFNWKLHLNIDRNAFIPLVDVHNKISKFKARNLNFYEKVLFKSLFEEKCTKVTNVTEPTIYDFDSFLQNLEKRTFYSKWKHIIFDDKSFFLAGGMVLQCLSKFHSDTNKIGDKKKQKLKDLDFFACNITYMSFLRKIEAIKLKLKLSGYKVVDGPDGGYNNYYKSHVVNLYVNFGHGASKNINVSEETLAYYQMYMLESKETKQQIKLHPSHPLNVMFNNDWHAYENYEEKGRLCRLLKDIKHDYNMKQINNEKNWTKLQFIHICRGYSYSPWSILHIFDIDACQVGYNGRYVLSTYAFIQSINTKTMINYKLIDNTFLFHMFQKRTKKYIKRGFNLLIDHRFIYGRKRNKFELNKEQELARNWDNERGASIKQSFIQHSRAAFAKYGNGGFGLNNDSFGIRKQFVKLLIRKLKS